MIILHASTLAGRFLLWAEAPPTSENKSAKRKRPSATPLVALSRFDPGRDRLYEALAAALPDPGVKASECESAVLWLPTTNDKPVASSALIEEPSQPERETSLAPWT